ncbi:MAG: peptidase S13 [Methylophaga sp.]|nr:peptidase S13 [Methylophaga sp.]
MKASFVLSFFLFNTLLVWSSPNFSNDVLKQYSELKHAGVLIANSQGKVLLESDKNKPFVPASTTKLVTAWLALKHWGENHYFRTQFYFDISSNTLWVKGSGDPFLVSEELIIIAKNLQQLGLSEVKTIALDNSQFQTKLVVPGASKSNNPYDAIPTSIAANFNTIDVKKIAGKFVSAETQTPITPIALKLASQQKIGQSPLRINTGFSPQTAEHYFAELLAVFLRQQGITVSDQIVWAKAPQQTPYYIHINSKSLGEIIRPMMKYSTNFIANQLVLMLSYEQFQRAANFSDVQKYMETTLHNHFGWQNIVLEEGAGLSRNNRLSPKQLVELLNDFRPWKHLLPEVTTNIYAKSGTLNNVSTLAGYAVDDSQHWNAFALMMPQSIRHKRRNMIAQELLNHSQLVGAVSAANKP